MRYVYINTTNREMTLTNVELDTFVLPMSSLKVRLRPNSRPVDGASVQMFSTYYPSASSIESYWDTVQSWVNDNIDTRACDGDVLPIVIMTRTAFEMFCHKIDTPDSGVELINFGIACVSSKPNIRHKRDSFGDLTAVLALDVRLPSAPIGDADWVKAFSDDL